MLLLAADAAEKVAKVCLKLFLWLRYRGIDPSSKGV